MDSERTAATGPILVGLDGSAAGAGAVRTGWALAERLHARAEFLHVVQVVPPLWPGLDDAAVGKLNEESLTYGRARMNEYLARELPAVREEFRCAALSVLHGHPARVLAQRAQERAARMLVLGKHRRHGLFHFGGVLRSTLSLAPCPVWVQPGEPRRVERILVPVDMSGASASALRTAAELARALSAQLSVAHFLDVGAIHAASAALLPEGASVTTIDRVREATRSSFERFLEQTDLAGIDVRSEMPEQGPIEGVLQRQDAFDLVVVGSHGRSGLARAILGSVAHDILRDAVLPVLVVPTPGASAQH